MPKTKEPKVNFNKADVVKINQELQLILDRDGYVTTKAIIEMARDERSAMHSYFLWDVQAAAEHCWNITAAYIVEKDQFVAQHIEPARGI